MRESGRQWTRRVGAEEEGKIDWGMQPVCQSVYRMQADAELPVICRPVSRPKQEAQRILIPSRRPRLCVVGTRHRMNVGLFVIHAGAARSRSLRGTSRLEVLTRGLDSTRRFSDGFPPPAAWPRLGFGLYSIIRNTRQPGGSVLHASCSVPSVF